jgi:hypothetical protein
MAKRTEEAAKMAGLIARKTGAPIEGSFEGNLQALINALNLHKVSNDHDSFSHVWTGVNQFLQTLETAGIMPVEGDTADIGSPTRLFRKGFFSELSTLIFKKENVLVMDGTFVITKQSGKFPADVAAADTQVDFGQTLTVGDFLLLRAENKTEYMQVGALVSGTVYNVTRNLDGSGANDWPAGSVFAVLGNQGDGRIEFVAGDDWRFSQIVQGSTYNSGMETVRIGKLDGWQVSTLSGPGMVIGDWSTGNYLYYSQATGKWVFKLAGGDVIINTETGIELKPGRALKFISGSNEKIAEAKVVFPGAFNNCPTLSLQAQRDSGADAAANMRASGTGKDGTIEVNPGNIYARVNSNLSGAAKMYMAVTDPNGTNGIVLDSAQINLGKKILADNITATPTADGIIKAKSDGKADIGWIPDLSSLYLGKTEKAADADKLDGIDSTGFVNTSGAQTVGGTKTFSSIPVLPSTNPSTANQAVRKGYADATYLGITAKAADADKLDGLDSTAFLQVPTWQAWTPTVTYLGGTTDPKSLTVDHARYCRTGNTVTFSIVATVERGSGNRTVVAFSLPLTAKYANFAASGTEDITSTTPKACGCYSDNAKRVLVRFATAMANDGKIRVSGSYEV